MNILKNKVIQNASWIILCKIVQAILNLVVTMLTARYLGPSNYGLISYAASLVAFAVPVMELGLRNTLVQEFVNAPDQEGRILGTAICMNLISAVFSMIGVVSFAAVANSGDKVTIIVCALYSGSLLFQAIETSQYWFQAKLLSKYTSLAMLFSYVVVSVYKIWLLISGKDVYWYACSQSIDYIIIGVILLILYKKCCKQPLSFSLALSRKLFSRSRYYIVSNLMVTIFAQTDKVMLNFMIDENATGLYSAAVTCATMTGFIFQAIINSARPVIFESHIKDKKAFEKNVSFLYMVIIYLSLSQCLLITIFSKWIILIIYGSEFTGAVNALRIIVWYTTFSYLGSVRNIWILAEEQQKYLWIINSSGASMNVVLNLILIPIYGIEGAAIASLITQIFTNVIMGYILRPIHRNNYLMIKGLDLRLLSGFLKRNK